MSQISSHKMLKEIKKLIKNPKPGFELITNGDINLKKLTILLHGPIDTPFENGSYFIDLIFTSEYPRIPPKGYFKTKIFHPNINYKTGEICVNTLKKDWNINYGIENVLISIRSLLILPNSDSALNADAGKLLRESYQSWFKQAKLFNKIHAIGNNKKKRKNSEISTDEEDNDSLLDTSIDNTINNNEKSDGKISNKENSKNKKKKIKKKENNINNNISNNNDNIYDINDDKNIKKNKNKKKHKSKKKKNKSALMRL